ncbi:MAG: aspartate/glutamate racemase family protein [Synergistetes bacterium]|nr:aspartate/glutamate racemase family protein [Synergistota bacterium]MDW8192386.1 aspartate/glutamate racemase family protein [Synergistota bacterium]
MNRHRVGLIRVLTIENEELLNAHGRMIEKAFPELKVISKCIEDQPNGIYDEETERIAKPKILRLIREFEEKESVEAIIISCAADPAVEEARETSKIPVIGAGSSSAAMALALGKKVGVLNLTEKTPKVFKSILKENLVAEDSPEGVKNTLDLLTDWGKEKALEAAIRLKERGSQVIAFACTGYSTIELAPLLEKEIKIPIVDAVLASGAVTLYALKIFKGR